MPDMLAIHWEKRRLRVVEASVGGSVRILHSFIIDIPEMQRSGWLKDALKDKGINARQAMVCLPREDAILRQLELPDAPDDELPALVYFQASTRSTTPLDQLLVDYLPLPRRSGSVQRDVLLGSVPRAQTDPIRAALGDAGIELVSLSLSSFALAELVLRAEDSHGQTSSQSRMVVLADANRLEVALLGKNEPLVAHLVRPPVDDQGRPIISKAAADISRVLVPAQPWLADSPIERIWLLGDSEEWDDLDQALRDRWNCPVDRFNGQVSGRIRGLDLAKLTGSIVSYGSAIGLLLGRVHPRSPVFDLLHPRQPRPKRDPRKLQLAVGSAAALLIVAMFTSYYQRSMWSLDEEIEEANKKAKRNDNLLAVDEPKRKAANAIEAWKMKDVNQIKQFTELYEIMDGTRRVYLTEYNFMPTTGDGIGKLHAVGNSRDRTEWTQLAARLSDSNRYRVKTKDLQQSRDDEYASRFDFDTELIAPGKTATGAASTTTAPNANATKDK